MSTRWGLFLLLAVTATLFGSGCSSSTPPYEYSFRRGHSAIVRPDGLAVAPRKAPKEVHRAVAAANGIHGSPYQLGGGHGGRMHGRFDCSGSTSYVLRSAGLLGGSMPSSSFRKFGKRGHGDWISVYARDGHVFLVIADLRFDTGWHHKGTPRGPRWTTKSRPADGYTVRHPPGL